MKQSVVRGVGIMMAATIVSRLLGYVRDYLIGSTFGTTGHTDAFWAAFGVPDLLYYLLAGGALGAAFIPVLTDYLTQGDDAEAWRVADTIATVILIASALGVAVIEIFAPSLVFVVVPGLRLKPQIYGECVFFVRIMAPMVFGTTLSALSSAILQSYRHFTAPAVAWLIYNIGIIFGAVVIVPHLHSADPRQRMVGLCVGVLIGAFLMVAAQLPALIRRGLRYRPRLDLGHPGVRLAAAMFIPIMAGLAVSQLSLLWFPYFFGSFFSGHQAGVITVIRYASRLIILPLGLFGVTISTAVFPALAERATLQQLDGVRSGCRDAIRAVSVMAIPSSIGLFVLAGPIIRLLWRGGEFGPAGVAASGFVLLFYAPGLMGLAAMQVVNRGFYAVKDRWTPPAIGVGYVALSVVLTLYLMRLPVGYGAIGLAASVAWLVGFGVSLPLLRRRLGGMGLRGLVASLARILLASLVMGVVVWYVSHRLGIVLRVPATEFRWIAPDMDAIRRADAAGLLPHISRFKTLVQVVLAMAAGAIAYVAALAALRAPELQVVRRAVVSRLRRR